jgi:hypothetical protein
MRFLICFVLAFFILSLTSCGGEFKQPRHQRADFKHADQAMVNGVRMVGEGLDGLTDKQMASVAALVVMTRVATLMEGPENIGSVMEGFWTELPEVCPPLPENTMKRFDDCWEFDIAYVAAMAECEKDEEKSEEECEKDNYGSLARAVLCRMKQIEALKEVFKFIPGRKWPDPPFPWPIVEPR